MLTGTDWQRLGLLLALLLGLLVPAYADPSLIVPLTGSQHPANQGPQPAFLQQLAVLERGDDSLSCHASFFLVCCTSTRSAQ
jgi:hypothetical protein